MSSCLYGAVLLWGLFLVHACPQGQDMCGEKVKFWLASTKNAKNQWIAQTGLEHPKKSGSASSGWKLQVENESTNCDGEDYCRLVASLSAVCPVSASDEEFPSLGIGRYKLFSNVSTWEGAKQTCQMKGAHLAIIDSKEEMAVLREVVRPNPNLYTWMGFSDKEKEGDFKDLFGNPVKNFWIKGQPDNWKNSEDCGCITKEGEMNDCVCEAKLFFICETPT